jgi:hypothetical protein
LKEIDKDRYSFCQNLRLVAWVFCRPGRLVARYWEISSLWYGLVPFIVYILACEFGWISAYLIGSYQAINPLPKFLPIADNVYPLYQAIFGPVVKSAGVIIFLLVFQFTAQAMKIPAVPLVPLVGFYLLVGNSLAFVAILVDQVIVWGNLHADVRFLLSTIHPLVFLIATVYVVAFLLQRPGISLVRAAILAIPAMILGGPVPGSIFR